MLGSMLLRCSQRRVQIQVWSRPCLYIKLAEALSRVPMNMPQAEQTPIRLAMPDQYKSDDPIESYRNYCIHEKHYAKWEKGETNQNGGTY